MAPNVDVFLLTVPWGFQEDCFESRLRVSNAVSGLLGGPTSYLLWCRRHESNPQEPQRACSIGSKYCTKSPILASSKSVSRSPDHTVPRQQQGCSAQGRSQPHTVKMKSHIARVISPNRGIVMLQIRACIALKDLEGKAHTVLARLLGLAWQ